MWQYRSWNKNACSCLRGRILRGRGERWGEERKYRRGGGRDRVTERGSDEVCRITGWHWKKPLCPFLLLPSLPLFTHSVLFTSHISSTDSPPSQLPTHSPRSMSVPLPPGGTARVPVSTPEECHKYFPKAAVNEIFVLRRYAACW